MSWFVRCEDPWGGSNKLSLIEIIGVTYDRLPLQPLDFVSDL